MKIKIYIKILAFEQRRLNRKKQKLVTELKVVENELKEINETFRDNKVIVKEAVITDERNFYCGVYGEVVAEYPMTVKVRFELNDGRHEATFFKDQVELV